VDASSLPPALPGEVETTRLDNGMTLAVVRNPQAPIVSTALVYRAGSRDEPAGRSGAAHFLEHVMFKGSGRYAPGEVDRRTQALGGTNNAFTSHDLTVYWFSFAADRWQEALEIEADRMRGLRLDAAEVDAERRVIVEEIAMYRDDPWDALEEEVRERLYGAHPYGRPILGLEEDLARVGPRELGELHRALYRPDAAVLVIAGDVGADAAEQAEKRFAALAGGAAPRPVPAAPRRSGLARVVRSQGEVARLLVALPAPAVGEPEHAELRLVATILAEGRASRLQRRLVEEGQLCLGVSASIEDSELASSFAVAAELLPGVDPGAVEAVVAEELRRLAAEPAGEEEIARAREVFLADWVFEHDRIHQQAIATAIAIAQGEPRRPDRLLRAAVGASGERLREVASRWLDPDRDAVVGVCLPESGEGGGGFAAGAR